MRCRPGSALNALLLCSPHTAAGMHMSECKGGCTVALLKTFPPNSLKTSSTLKVVCTKRSSALSDSSPTACLPSAAIKTSSCLNFYKLCCSLNVDAVDSCQTDQLINHCHTVIITHHNPLSINKSKFNLSS